MKSLTLNSPAKINLFLKILKKRSDGFHAIETLFHRIDLKDTIRFKLNSTGKIKITTNHPQVPTGSKNLIYKVAKTLKDKYEISEGVDMHIQKNIPVAAGLAGGSTNAATALLGLNRLWRLKLTKRQLLNFAHPIGSDVAFFLYDSTYAVGTERGDFIKPITIKSKFWFILVVPKVKLYAGEIYGGLKHKLTKNNDNVNILTYHLRQKDLNAVSDKLRNDLEPVVLDVCPSIVALKERLKSLNAKAVMVSGSGPAVFGLMKNRKEAEHARSVLAKRFSQVFVTKTL